MEIKALPKLPNDGYEVAANWSCVMDDKILFGGGSGFIEPLANGGAKQLSNSIRLLELKNHQWVVVDHYQVKLNNQAYGFCNGVSLKLNDTTTAFVGGLKKINDTISNSSDVLICELKNNKLKVTIYENALPVSGEMVGAINDENIACILAGNNQIILIDFNKIDSNKPFSILKAISPHGYHVSRGQVIWDYISKKWAFLGGYIGFSKDDVTHSNLFNLNQLLFWEGSGSFQLTELTNFKTNPLTYLGASSLWDESLNCILLVGGVNQKKFTEAVFKLSTLKDEELVTYKKLYFNHSPEYFDFNKKLVLIDLTKKSLKEIGILPTGLAGNPSFVKCKNNYYVLSGEIKPGVRLSNPWKISFDN